MRHNRLITQNTPSRIFQSIEQLYSHPPEFVCQYRTATQSSSLPNLPIPIHTILKWAGSAVAARSLILLRNADDKRTHVIPRRLIVSHVSSVAEGEGSRLPTTAVHLLTPRVELIHRRDLGRIQVNLFVDLAGSVEETGCACSTRDENSRVFFLGHDGLAGVVKECETILAQLCRVLVAVVDPGLVRIISLRAMYHLILARLTEHGIRHASSTRRRQ